MTERVDELEVPPPEESPAAVEPEPGLLEQQHQAFVERIRRRDEGGEQWPRS